MSFLTDLYLKKGLSLRQISNELGCCKATVRKKLTEVGIEIKNFSKNEHLLKNTITNMKSKGSSYQAIADSFNLWKIPTRTGEGRWHAKSIRDILLRL